mgnify:CR=1 FL=1
MFQFRQDVTWPKYWVGEYEDKEEEKLTFTNPNSKGESITISFSEEGGFTSAHTSEEGEPTEKVFELRKKRRR